MSLYGGIKFAIGKPGGDLSEGKTGEGSAAQGSTSSTTQNKNTTQPSKPVNGKGSAALKFAPRIRQPKTVQAPRSGPTTSYSAEPVFIDTQLSAAVSSSASSSTGQRTETTEVVIGNDGRPLARAPAMTIAAAQKGKLGDDERKKKKKKKRRRQQQVLSDFKPDEQYDPNRPNDLSEYQYYRKKLKEERRAQLVEAKRRREEHGSSGESSYYSDSEEEVPRRDAPKTWAPPKMYDAPGGSKPHSNSGDDAYAKRLAMSRAPINDNPPPPPPSFAPPPPPHGESTHPAPNRFVAPSSTSTHIPPPPPSYVPPPPPPQASAAHPPPNRFSPSNIPNNPPPPPPNQFVAPPAGITMPPFAPTRPPSTVNMPPFPPSGPTSFAPTSSFSDIPGFGRRQTPSSVPAEPVTTTNSNPSSTPSATTPSGDDFARLLEEKKKAAASIAERLRNLGPAAPPVHAPIPEPDTGGGTFAEKMMRKWGHKEGTGLGADGSGIVHALTAEHVAKPVDPKQPLSKRQLAKQKAAAANAKSRKWVQHASTRGKIVNAAEIGKKEEEQSKYGEAGRIICLVGLVGSEDEIDEDLSEEIGEECSKYGIVERVVQHLVEPPPPDPAECLRVFIVFSGMAGAWRSIKELDGRFFGGRKIRATYFDEARFDSGERDGPVL